jgi:hypothetical protein
MKQYVVKWSLVSVFMMAATACGGESADQAGGEQPGHSEEAVQPAAGLYKQPARTYGVSQDGQKLAQDGIVQDLTGLGDELTGGGKARGISGDGTVVVGQNPALVPAFWTQGQGWVALPLPTGSEIIPAAEPFALDSNTDGSKMVGYATVKDPMPGLPYHARDTALVWNATVSNRVVTPTTLSVLPIPSPEPAHTNCYPLATMRLSDTKTFNALPVGAITFAAVGHCNWYGDVATMWTRTKTATGGQSGWISHTFIDPETGNPLQGTATSVSSDGTWVAGGIVDGTPVNPPFAPSLFRYNTHTKVFDRLGKCPSVGAGKGSRSAYISDDGNTVVGTFDDGLGGGGVTCIWTSGVMQDLLNWLYAKVGGAALSLDLTSVGPISRTGRVITGGKGYLLPSSPPWALSW